MSNEYNEKRIFVLRNKKSKYISLVVRLDKQIGVDQYKYSVELMVTSVNGWGGDDNIDDITEEMVGSATIKNGACSHWWFKGEGTIGIKQDEVSNSYYHLCGFRGYDTMAMGIFFAYKVADKVIGDLEDLDEYETKHMKIYEQLFEDFEIEEILDGHIPQEPSDF